MGLKCNFTVVTHASVSDDYHMSTCSFKLLSSLTPLFLLLHHFARDRAAHEHRSLEIGVDHVGDRLGRG